MAHEPESRVADIVAAAGGRLASRVRLQKIAYLLDKLGAKSDFSYTYYHYGPYSRDLDSAILDAEAFGKIKEDFERRKSDGARYSVFTSILNGDRHDFSFLTDSRLRDRAKELASVNVTVLELAATAHWLFEEEKITDWKTEIVRRKGAKTQNGRLDEATRLLQHLGLSPASMPR
jgi:uncharacterized protein YwgA